MNNFFYYYHYGWKQILIRSIYAIPYLFPAAIRANFVIINYYKLKGNNSNIVLSVRTRLQLLLSLYLSLLCTLLPVETVNTVFLLSYWFFVWIVYLFTIICGASHESLCEHCAGNRSVVAWKNGLAQLSSFSSDLNTNFNKYFPRSIQP